MGGYVYILESPTCSRYYIGSSENPERRLIEHNRGYVSATRSKGPWHIVLKQVYPTTAIARKVEFRLKRLKSRRILEQMVQEGYIRLIS
jgi:putative endonuclease